MSVKSAYIHIPFCKTICSYCDFCKFLYNEKWVYSYLDALSFEIENNYNKDKLDTIYVGGGTPSSLNIKELKKLFNILKNFNLEEDYEFTIECNIEDITKEKLELFKKNKVNRISIGIQTFNKKFLKQINRDKNVDVVKNINLVKKYFDNINVDLMYAFENETLSDLKKDIDEFLKLNINHISCYSLIIEKNTKFYNDDVHNIDEDLDYEMYKLITDTLKKNGFIHYEISNYSKDGYKSRHNLTYWNNNQYYGFGVSASGYIDNKRYTNTKNIVRYNMFENKKEEEILKEEDKMMYEMILNLRKMEGVNKKSFYDKYTKNIEDVFDIKKLLLDKYLIDDGDKIYINEKYLYISNEILINFI